jgi:hypothetical protein
LAFLAGGVLRAKDLGAQIVVGDELHALRVAASQDAAYIATHNVLPGEAADYSIPLALWNLLLMRTVGLEEWGMRLPVLVAGILMVPLISVFVWHAVGRLEGVLVAWWFAGAPVFIHFSRLARPYAAVAFLTLLAMLGWLRWQRTGRWLPGIVAACSGALAIWFSLASGPAVACLWGFGLILAIARAGWARWAAIALAGVLIAAALLAPSLAAQREFVAGIRERGAPTLVGWWGCARIMFGTRSDHALACLLAMTALGAVVAFRRSPAAVSMAALMMAGQIAACHVIGPLGIHDPGIAARYTIAALPGVLVLTCLGLCALARGAGAVLGRPRVVVPCASAAMLGAFVASGWLPSKYARANVDTSNWFAAASPDRERIPRFYRALARTTGDVTIVEWPWLPHWTDYQDVHGKRIVAVKQQLLREKGFRFRSMVSTEAVLAGQGGFDYVVVHKDPVREWLFATGAAAVADSDALAAGFRAGAAASLDACRGSASLREIHEDEWVAVLENATRR